MKMETKTLVLALSLAASLSAGSALADGARGADGQWNEIAPSVFQRIDADGSVYRQSYGDDGARYELAQFKNELNARLADGAVSAETIANLRKAVEDLQQRVDSAPSTTKAQRASSPSALLPTVIDASAGLFGFNNTPTPVCGFVAHQMADFRGDASIEPGGGGGEATSSIMYYGFVPGLQTYTATFYVSASVTPSGYPTQSINATTTATVSSGSTPGPTLFTRTIGSTPTAFSIAASTSSYMNIPGCTGGFQSFSKSQTL